MTTGDPDLTRLAKYVAARRASLRLSKDGAALKAGISRITWRKVEDGRKVRDTMYAAVEDGLDWEPGSVARVLAGGEPSLTVAPGPTVDPDKVLNAANVLDLVLRQFGPDVYEAAHEVVMREQSDTDRGEDRRA